MAGIVEAVHQELEAEDVFEGLKPTRFPVYFGLCKRKFTLAMFQ